MAISRRRSFLGFILIFATVFVLKAVEPKPFFQEFAFQGKAYAVFVDQIDSLTDVFLTGRGSPVPISRSFRGENIAPAVCVGSDNFYITWINYQSRREVFIGRYDHVSQQSFRHPLGFFHFVAAPQLVLAEEKPIGLLFLANRTGNDDLFYLDLNENILRNISDSTVSEKSFSWRWQEGLLVITAVTLSATTDYAFDPLTRTLCWRKSAAGGPALVEKAETARSAATGSEVNNFIAFGDSITWGKMRMLDLEGEYHPELAYPALVQELLQTSYGTATAFNLGIPGDSTLGGAQRIVADLVANPAGYFLVMLGTNDVISNQFSIDSSLENLAYIIDQALSRDLQVVISTIPPRKDFMNQFAYVRNNIAALNSGIQSLAEQKSIAVIDTYQAFMNFNPPDGWMTLLEDIVGNHPSPAGQQVIAGLFEPEVVAFAPRPPADVVIHSSALQPWAEWGQNYESDFGHYQVEFGFQIDQLVNSLTTPVTAFTLSRLPFFTELYFHIRSIDRNDNQSEFTAVYSTIP